MLIVFLSLANDINVRDSKEFERKIFSSTPDSSAVFTSSGGRRFEVPNEIADYRIINDQQYDQHLRDDEFLEYNNEKDRQSPTKKKITINMTNYSTNYKDDNDNQDTFSNVSDIDNNQD